MSSKRAGLGCRHLVVVCVARSKMLFQDCEIDEGRNENGNNEHNKTVEG
jgi:hypothetical protein